ncbi:MAG: DNA-binding response regulator [Rubritepida sp.]|nr:DNA-binding response regulator [Rubritepida sp.]
MTISHADSVHDASPLVFIAEDDIDLAQEVADCFDLYSFRTQITESWPELIKALQGADPDLILLDKQLGRVDAVARIGELRRETSAYIIVVTGYGSAADCIIGLELGADGFLTKPVSSRELVVRVRAVLRRKSDAAASSAGRWQVMLEDGAVQMPDGRRVLMAKPHLAVLDLLIGAGGKPLSRQALMVALEDDPAVPADREQMLTRILCDLRRGLAGVGAKGALRAFRNRGLAFLPATEA